MSIRLLLGFLILLHGCNDSPEGDAVSTAISTPIAAETAGPTQAWFEEVAMVRGVRFNYHSGANGNYNIIETMGGGAALLDYDDDGDLDLYLVQGNVLDGSPRSDLVNRLYENTGDGRFIDRTEGSGADDAGYGVGVASGDYDNDGDVDLYVTNLGPNTLLRNEGGGVFIDATATAGVGHDGFSACAAFADIDLDGDLDLFVTNYLDWTPGTERECFSSQSRRDYCNPVVYDAAVPDVLYINEGDGTFRDASESSGISSVPGTGLGVAIAPVNGDALPDIFVANDGMPDRLWINLGNGDFQEKAMQLGCALDDSGKAKAGMGAELVDLDRDGDLDLIVTNLFQETDSFYLNKDGAFVDSSARWGLAADTRTFTRWGIAVEDFDNDGLDDLYEATARVRWQADLFDQENWLAEPNLLFRQVRPGRFELASPAGGTGSPLFAAAHGVAAGDLDGDGGIDLVIVNKDAGVHILRNTVPGRGNWITLDVRNEHGAPAIGAVIETALADGMTSTSVVRTARGYASAHDPRIHIGLGQEERVDSVKVRWPDGTESIFESLAAGQVHELRP